MTDNLILQLTLEKNGSKIVFDIWNNSRNLVVNLILQLTPVSIVFIKCAYNITARSYSLFLTVKFCGTPCYKLFYTELSFENKNRAFILIPITQLFISSNFICVKKKLSTSPNLCMFLECPLELCYPEKVKSLKEL